MDLLYQISTMTRIACYWNIWHYRKRIRNYDPRTHLYTYMCTVHTKMCEVLYSATVKRVYEYNIGRITARMLRTSCYYTGKILEYFLWCRSGRFRRMID